MGLSGAKVTISPRTETGGASQMRVVTIIGQPANTQAASILIKQKLSQVNVGVFLVLQFAS
jgi:hypothetical protein